MHVVDGVPVWQVCYVPCMYMERTLYVPYVYSMRRWYVGMWAAVRTYYACISHVR